jgi:hypothetical protein
MVNTRTVRAMTAEEKRVIFAWSLGTIFEWYDFYLFGVLTARSARWPTLRSERSGAWRTRRP